jgi:transposase
MIWKRASLRELICSLLVSKETRHKPRKEARVTKYTSLDSHKHYSVAAIDDERGRSLVERRIEHEPGNVRAFLETARLRKGTPVAVETIGNYYWIVQEIEDAGMKPLLVHAGKAKKRMGLTSTNDKLSAHGLNLLQRTHALPVVWIPSKELRDLRALTRTRMVFTRQGALIRNRFHAVLAKYCLQLDEVSDIFAPGAREELEHRVKQLPTWTYVAAREQLDYIDHFAEEVKYFNVKIAEAFEGNDDVEILRTLPGVGEILAVIIWLEVGDVSRFPRSASLATYAGTTPRLHDSGKKRRLGQVRVDVNRYLKWAFIEAANVCCMNRRRGSGPNRHVTFLYERVRRKRNHFKAVVAVARHLAEATYWMLTKHEPYRDPQQTKRALA